MTNKFRLAIGSVLILTTAMLSACAQRPIVRTTTTETTSTVVHPAVTTTTEVHRAVAP